MLKMLLNDGTYDEVEEAYPISHTENQIGINPRQVEPAGAIVHQVVWVAVGLNISPLGFSNRREAEAAAIDFWDMLDAWERELIASGDQERMQQNRSVQRKFIRAACCADCEFEDAKK